jgi:hypothetical protein
VNPSADDYIAIMNLYASYNLASDLGDATAFSECFTSDGVLAAEPDIRVSGRPALAEYKAADVARRNGRYRRHVNATLHLTHTTPDEVVGRCYLQAFNGTPGELPVLDVTGIYTDTVVRSGGVWLFQQRHLTRDQ